MLTKLESFFRKVKLGQKVTILLLLVALGGVLTSGAVLASILNYNAQDQITSKALILTETMDAVRDYTSTQVNPLVEDQLSEEFLPQSVPAYSAREVFEKLRQDQSYSDFFYKEATLNPTNLRDQADDFETAIVERFRQTSTMSETRGFRKSPGGDLFYIASPLKVTSSSCLECHSTPARAPASMIERYGTAHGFGWQLDEIVGTQIIYVPADSIIQNARQIFVLIMGIIVIFFAVAILAVNVFLKRYIVRPVNKLARSAEAASTGDMEVEFEATSDDEIGQLTAAFNRMKTSLALAMKRLEKYRSSQS